MISDIESDLIRLSCYKICFLESYEPGEGQLHACLTKP